MVFGLERIFNKNETPEWKELDTSLLPFCKEEDIQFETKNFNTRTEIIAHIDGCTSKNIEVQFNYYNIFVKGEAIVDGHVEIFSRQFPMPKGAIKKSIQAIVTKDSKLKIIIPLERSYIPTKEPKYGRGFGRDDFKGKKETQ